jgi:uncharacterized protein involved in propanediol utilization
VRNYIRQFTRLYPVTLFINREGRVTQFMGGMPMLSATGAEHGGKVNDSEFRMHLTSIAGPPPAK